MTLILYVDLLLRLSTDVLESPLNAIYGWRLPETPSTPSFGYHLPYSLSVVVTPRVSPFTAFVT